ncbi:MAG: FliM/FliN family flagellar motor switch protein [SAR324 cluster bacterium]|nr:FliM/FliN family flagellar motor switch protein [SAR324 cluster bacterium]MBF0353058.1 FliM/FliN family flagellar motor switch protein [SAR324 cluster bacterium]
MKDKEQSALTAKQIAQFEQLLDMDFTVRFILGECTMEIGDILNLGQGSILELENWADQPFELWVNDRHLAKAETVVVNERFGARITEIGTPEKRINELASE